MGRILHIWPYDNLLTFSRPRYIWTSSLSYPSTIVLQTCTNFVMSKMQVESLSHWFLLCAITKLSDTTCCPFYTKELKPVFFSFHWPSVVVVFSELLQKIYAKAKIIPLAKHYGMVWPWNGNLFYMQFVKGFNGTRFDELPLCM